MSEFPLAALAKIPHANSAGYVYTQDDLKFLELELTPLQALNKFLTLGVPFKIPRPQERENLTRDIGVGGSSTVFELGGEFTVLKKELITSRRFGDDDDNVASAMQYRVAYERSIARTFDEHGFRHGPQVVVPRNMEFMHDWERFWDHYRDGGSPTFRMDMIHSVPTIVRRALINHFHPREKSPMDPKIVEEILHRRENRHCWVHPYLGLRDGLDLLRFTGCFTLEDFGLSPADMKQLGLNTRKLAESMGEALAVIHFKCKAVGHVKFVIAASPQHRERKFGPLMINLHIPSFSHLQKIEEDDTAEKKIMLSMLFSGYIPRPRSAPHEWKCFKAAYIKQGKTCLTDQRDLPRWESMPTPEGIMERLEKEHTGN